MFGTSIWISIVVKMNQVPGRSFGWLDLGEKRTSKDTFYVCCANRFGGGGRIGSAALVVWFYRWPRAGV